MSEPLDLDALRQALPDDESKLDNAPVVLVNVKCLATLDPGNFYNNVQCNMQFETFGRLRGELTILRIDGPQSIMMDGFEKLTHTQIATAMLMAAGVIKSKETETAEDETTAGEEGEVDAAEKAAEKATEADIASYLETTEWTHDPADEEILSKGGNVSGMVLNIHLVDIPNPPPEIVAACLPTVVQRDRDPVRFLVLPIWRMILRWINIAYLANDYHRCKNGTSLTRLVKKCRGWNRKTGIFKIATGTKWDPNVALDSTKPIVRSTSPTSESK
jgi:hypothetical protein